MKLRNSKTTLLSLALVAAFCGGAVLDANAARRGEQKKEEVLYPDATRQDPEAKGSPKVQTKLNKLIEAYNKALEQEDEAKATAGYTTARTLADEIIANGSANAYDKALAAQIASQAALNTDDEAAAERRDRAEAMLAKVGLAPEHFNRYPHMFSGGQRQRIAIARALMLNPALLVLDEPVSALDLSVQAQVLNLLADLQDEFNLTYVFISHDLSVVRYIADDVLVLSKGVAVEQGSREAIFANPQHPYTQQLFAATPVTDVASIRARVERRKAARVGAGIRPG